MLGTFDTLTIIKTILLTLITITYHTPWHFEPILFVLEGRHYAIWFGSNGDREVVVGGGMGQCELVCSHHPHQTQYPYHHYLILINNRVSLVDEGGSKAKTTTLPTPLKGHQPNGDGIEWFQVVSYFSIARGSVSKHLPIILPLLPIQCVLNFELCHSIIVVSPALHNHRIPKPMH